MTNPLYRIATALGSGLLFGIGLALSGMTDPARVRAFLDLGGAWNPSLALVMAGATTVAFVGYRAAFRRGRPVLADQFNLPPARPIDVRLISGSALFGIGWGLVGLCPGPALVDLATGSVRVALFFVAMLAGMALPALGSRASPRSIS
jgi:hypothetical protein